MNAFCVYTGTFKPAIYSEEISRVKLEKRRAARMKRNFILFQLSAWKSGNFNIFSLSVWCDGKKSTRGKESDDEVHTLLK